MTGPNWDSVYLRGLRSRNSAFAYPFPALPQLAKRGQKELGSEPSPTKGAR